MNVIFSCCCNQLQLPAVACKGKGRLPIATRESLLNASCLQLEAPGSPSTSLARSRPSAHLQYLSQADLHVPQHNCRQLCIQAEVHTPRQLLNAYHQMFEALCSIQMSSPSQWAKISSDPNEQCWWSPARSRVQGHIQGLFKGYPRPVQRLCTILTGLVNIKEA
jgi:hypothetical protein